MRAAPRRIPRSARYGLLRYPRQIPRYRLLPDRVGLWRGDLEDDRASFRSSQSQSDGDWKSKLLESLLTTAGSVAILGAAGYGYHHYYKSNVLAKIENAFDAGYSSLEQAALARQTDGKPIDSRKEVPDAAWWIQREEQRMVDDMVAGRTQGYYYLITGEKGTGKTSMILEGMRKVNGESVALVEAHGDPEIFRVRLGKALDYEFHEDYIGSLFSFKGPRDTTALLDIERAFNKLEKVALAHRQKRQRPLVLVVNGVHTLRHDEDGRDLLDLIQQRAEMWAASGLATLVLLSSDFWITETLQQQATRMQTLTIPDVPREMAVGALRNYRHRYHDEVVPARVLDEVYNKVGGRMRFLSQVARADDMLVTCDSICRKEKTWLLNQAWVLGAEMDDDVMDQQKFCSATMVLAQALVDLEAKEGSKDPTQLPQLPLHEARQTMTRADFLEQVDHLNIVAIDPDAMVRADSVPMQRAFREVCAIPGFREHLQATLDRISDIESLGRTRELVLKDLVGDGEYQVEVKNAKGYDVSAISFKTKPPVEQGDDA